jgi:glyoxylase-like metal-dependent hydrolase (beta-lactamase superfamily II)
VKIEPRFHEPTFTYTYLVWDEATRDAVVIDPVLDLDTLAWQTSTGAADALCARVEALGLRVHWVLETHAHADHLSAAPLLRQRWSARVGISERITAVQSTFGELFDLGAALPTDGRQFDGLFADGQTIVAGSLKIKVLHTPGHTPACASYLVGDAVFTGDALFVEDFGTGRCDFPGGSAADLYRSISNGLYRLPDATRVFVGHDYGAGGREVRCETTIGDSKQLNPYVRADTSEEEFVSKRAGRDAELSPPKLIFPAVQINANGGRLPAPRENGTRYLRIPLNLFGPTDDIGQPQ